MKLNKTSLAFNTRLKFCFIPDASTICDTKLLATDKAVQNIEEGKQDIFVIANHGNLLVIHDSEGNIQQEITLQSTSNNHGWKAII